MLVALAALVGRDVLDRFFVFAFVFGVWDIVYYVGLRLCLGWPESLLTWDILFLLPLPWLAPVLYPVMVSLALVAGCLLHDALRARGRVPRLGGVEWLVASAGASVIVVAFCWNWRTVLEQRIPTVFPAALFFAGLLCGTAPFVRAFLRSAREG
jgi:hypothetical protein